MLGPRYDPEKFYVRSSPRADWVETYSRGPYRRNARGRLMAIRVVQGLFDDEWLTERPFDPAANTQALINALDVYKEYGVLSIVVSLQGADPGYSETASGIQRGPQAADGKTAGALVSAFQPDGSLKPDWMERLEALIAAAEQRGMFVCLVYFTENQDEALENSRAVVAAARNITRWLIAKDFRNVIIDVADAWDIEYGLWDHFEFIPRQVANLVREVREQFNGAAFSLPIGASTGASMVYPASLARLSDVVLLHAEGRPARSEARSIQQFSDYGRPVWIVSDYVAEKSGSQEGLRASAAAGFSQGAGWTYNPRELSQLFPFRYLPEEDGEFMAVLEAIAKLTLRKPPAKRKK